MPATDKAIDNYSFRRFSFRRIFIVFSVVTAYVGLSFFLIGFKTDQLVLSFLFCLFYFGNHFTRKLILGFSIFIIYWIVYDYMKAFPNHRFNTVHLKDLYDFEKEIFGIRSGGLLLTPNEFWILHSNKFLHILAGIFYLCWVPVPLLFAVYLFIRNKEQFVKFSLTFLFVNILGFIGYYLYPAAPPWYIHKFGNAFNALTPGDAAGLAQFDALTGVNIFKALYSRNSNVFAAMPSLHSSYLLIVLYYGIKNKMKWLNVIFGVLAAGIWFSAVYSNHHYVLDVLGGIVCAIFGIIFFEWLIKNVKWPERQIKKFVRFIE